MHMVGYFEGLASERGIAWRCSDSHSLRDFLRLENRLPPVWAAFRGSAGSGTVLFCGSGDEKCPQVQLWAQVRENGGDTGRGLKR
jgi:hypothetical protein